VVVRPRLFVRLDQGLEKKLTLVSTPAGYGKTILLSAWASRGRVPVAWIALDEGENDPARFLAYLLAALEKIEPGFGSRLSSLFQSPHFPPQEALLPGLINAIAQFEQPFALVLDDYHLIQAQAIHDALISLINHLPPQMHLYIAARADPPLKLARLRARSELVELRLADLCFSEVEAEQFFNGVMRLGLEQNQVTILAARAEGWIAGLQMAAVSLLSAANRLDFIQSFSGSNRFILDYLGEEVLRSQAPEVQAFLIQTSILDRLAAPLCDAVTGQPGSQAILESLERLNLFIIPQDEERTWYRYHQLFRDFLSKRAQQVYPGQAVTWHRRACAWFETQDSLEEAIEHALAAGDHAHAADLIETAAQPTLARSEIYTFRSWASRLPEEILETRPDLILSYAWALVLTDSPPETVEAWLAKVEPGSEKIAHKAGVIRGYLAYMQGEVFLAAFLLQQALAGLPVEESLFRSVAAWLLSVSSVSAGDFSTGRQALEELVQASLKRSHWMIAAGALCALAEIHLRLGQLPLAKADYERALALAQDARGRLPVAARPLMGLGELYREWNDLEQAARLCLEGIELTKHLREGLAIAGYITLAHIRQVTGDGPGSEAAIQKASELAVQTGITNLDDLYVELYRAKLAILRGDLTAADRWVQARGLGGKVDLADLEQKDNYYKYHILKYELLVAARWHIARDQPQKALAWLEDLQAKMEDQDRIHLVIECLLLRSIANQALGDRAQAAALFDRCLSLAEPGGYMRLFLDEGPAARALYQEAVQHGTAGEYAGRLLAASEAGASEGEVHRPASSTLPPQPGVPGEPFAEPLTEREIELLALIAAGLSNQDIALRLFISLPTVKWHTTNIYGKLGVRSRTQAVARARARGILPAS
jgi:LuxR family maltose regulon positive regulatory protein